MLEWAVVILAAFIGAASSIAATALTMWWTGRHDAERQTREEAAALRAEKRSTYRDVMQSLDAWRDATATLANGDRESEMWAVYWQARDACLRSGATLSLVGHDDMIGAASEVSEALLDVSWSYQTHTALAFGEKLPSEADINASIWVHIATADREMGLLLGFMRADLGIAPLERDHFGSTAANGAPSASAGNGA